MRFSIIIVCLNAGEELSETVKSVLSQDYSDYEIIIKDGGSTDGSIDSLPVDQKINIIKKSDRGIYDAMNQALDVAKGDFVYFLNCGDYLMDNQVLNNVSKQIDEFDTDYDKVPEATIFYGNILDRISETVIMSNPVMDEFACYRNVPCHQACFYSRKMVLMHPFMTEYVVRSDYEQFLWCKFIAKAELVYMDMTISSYMGGGFSETEANRKKSNAEHKTIVENYMPHSHVVRYRLRMLLSLAPLRARIARNPITSGIYNKLKSTIYSRKK